MWTVFGNGQFRERRAAFEELKGARFVGDSCQALGGRGTERSPILVGFQPSLSSHCSGERLTSSLVARLCALSSGLVER